MKVGIITVYDSANVGSYMQALAMQELVRRNGDEPYMIKTRSDFATLCLFLGYNFSKGARSWSTFFKFLVDSVKHLKITSKRFHKYMQYRKDWSEFEKIVSVHQAEKLNLDILLIGSDEIWNAKRPAFQNPYFYGIGVHAKKKIAYAISAGDAEEADFLNHKMLIEDGVKKIDEIYPRDSYTASLLRELGVNAEKNIVDPTLQIDVTKYFKEEDKKLEGKKYILVYSYFVGENHRQNLIRYARENNLILVDILLRQDWCDRSISYSPLEFGNVVKHAEAVFTSTFHGTIFSMLLNKKFVVLAQLPKIIHLLDQFDMSGRSIADDIGYEEFCRMMQTEIDYSGFNGKLSQCRDNSASLLKAVLHGETKKNMRLCERENCTGCAVCAFVCPKQCISMQTTAKGILYPQIDNDTCIRCGKCAKACPQLNPVPKNENIACYAAWSAKPEIRKKSASGGIATALYQQTQSAGGYFVGARQFEDFSVRLVLGSTDADIQAFVNSKYVFCDASQIYAELKAASSLQKKICVIGLPCQIAAIRKCIGDSESILFVDLVCHGTTPDSYLKQHLSEIERNSGHSAATMSFRDAGLGTEKYFFTVSDENGRQFYAKRRVDGDLYNYGYHKAISYRENCYRCIYADSRRVSDITLSDYKGLGTMEPCGYDQNSVSCVMIHTEKGKSAINELIQNGDIIAESRPVLEPVTHDAQYTHPSIKSDSRLYFEKAIVICKGDFTAAIAKTKRHEDEILHRKEHKKKRYLAARVVRKIARRLRK